MIDMSKYSIAKMVQCHLGKKLLIEFREKQISEDVITAETYIDNEKITGQLLEDCRKIFSEFEF